MAKIDAFFKYMIDKNASDLHLSVGSKPLIRKHGELEEMPYQVLTDDILKALLFELLSDDQKKVFSGDQGSGFCV